jgi:GT2 family glycosyltransferase
LNEHLTTPHTKLEAANGIPPFEPVRLLEVELAGQIPRVSTPPAPGARHRRAQALVRLHTRPLGLVRLELGDHGLESTELAERIWSDLAGEINRHLLADNVPALDFLPTAGISSASLPLCVKQRRQALRRAPFVSVAIATRDRPGMLADCLDSLVALEYPSYEILVVDNAPGTDTTQELVRTRYSSRPGPPVRYIHEPRPGLAAAHNRGVRETSAEIIAFTDDDVVVDRFWLLELVRRFESQRVGCVTGMILPLELETPAQVWLEQYGGFSKGFDDALFDLDENRPAAPLFPYTAGTFGSGASMAFRTDVLRLIGGFDPAIGAGTLALGGDDLAAFFDVVAAGYGVAYAPAALVRHRHRRDYESLRRQAYGYGVGLTAFLTKTVLDRPTRLLEIARRMPRGLAHALRPTSEKNAGKQADYPQQLTRLELKGMVHGPTAYIRSRRARPRRSGTFE